MGVSIYGSGSPYTGSACLLACSSKALTKPGSTRFSESLVGGFNIDGGATGGVDTTGATTVGGVH